MAFAMKRGRGIGSEARRLFARQLAGAIVALSGPRCDVRAARRRIKKARAVLLLLRSAPGSKYSSADRRLRKVGFLLGTLTDASAAAGALEQLRGYDPERLPDLAIDQLRDALTTLSRQLNTKQDLEWVRARALRLLLRQRVEFDKRATFPLGVHATAAVIRRARRDARKARRDAIEHPTPAQLHAWRRCTKREWYLLRLIDDEVLGALADDTRRLERLDGALGRLHDVNMLQQYVATCSPLPRRDTANALRVARAFAGDLKHRLWRHLDAQDEPPGMLEARVVSLWLSGEPLDDDADGMQQVRHARAS